MSTDEEQGTGRALRTLMLQAEVPPARTDVALAVRLGRRAERRRRAVTAATAALAVVGVVAVITTTMLTPTDRRDPPEPAAPGPLATSITDLEQIEARVPEASSSRCGVEPLAALPGLDQTAVQAADSTGRFVVGSGMPAGANSSVTNVLWDNGVPSPIVLDSVPGAGRMEAVNASGVVVGWGVEQKERQRTFGWVYQDGQIRKLAMPPGSDSAQPSAINDRGDAVGLATQKNGGVPVIWPAADDGAPRVLDEPGGYQVRGVTDDGSVIGTMMSPQGMRLWGADGARITVPMPGGWRWMTLWDGVGDWISGLVASGEEEESPTATLRWNVRTGKVSIFTNLDTRSVLSMSVNSKGWLAVTTREHGPLLVAPDGAVERLPVPAGATSASTVSISDNGVVTGNASSGAGAGTTAVTWKCR